MKYPESSEGPPESLGHWQRNYGGFAFEPTDYMMRRGLSIVAGVARTIGVLSRGVVAHMIRDKPMP